MVAALAATLLAGCYKVDIFWTNHPGTVRVILTTDWSKRSPDAAMPDPYGIHLLSREPRRRFFRVSDTPRGGHAHDPGEGAGEVGRVLEPQRQGETVEELLEELRAAPGDAPGAGQGVVSPGIPVRL